VRQRNAFRRREETALLQMAVASVLSEKAGKQLANLLKRMDESD
jgi:GTP cyclohydrolase FolE2